MTSPTPRERIIGGLVGLAVGDALGVPVEFTGRAMRDADPVVGMRGFGTWNQPAGTWSDDSSLAFASADRLGTHGWDPEAQLSGFLAWLDQSWWTPHGRVFDIGNATQTALMRKRVGLPWNECGGDEEHSNGNGGLMRLLPASCWLFGRPTEEIIRLAGESSALTHAHPRSRLCAAFHALVSEDLLSGATVRVATMHAAARLHRHVPLEERTALAALLDGSALDQPRSRVRSDGYVVSTLEAALWCLEQHDDYSAAVLAAVNLGGDTDTTGAVAGGLAGLRGGLTAIPPEWINALARRDEVMALAGTFADACLAGW